MAGRGIANTVRGRAPRWVLLAAIIVASRVVSTGWLLLFAARQGDNAWTEARPSLWDFSRIWDAHWYRIIAEVGYPAELPLTDSGEVGENAWAFMPVYPFLVRALMAVTGGSFAVVSVIVSVAAFAAFIVLLDRLFRTVLPARQALAAVAVVAFSPVSPIFQVGYAESLGMLLVVAVLWAAARGRFVVAAALMVVAALTRPVGVPLALWSGIMLVVTWRRSDRNRRGYGALSVVGASAAALWPAIAWLVTGRVSAYLDTEFAWRRAYTDGQHLPWGTGWWHSAQWWFHEAGPWVLGAVAVTAIVIAALPATRRMGTVLGVWTVSYLTYLVVVLFPQSSIFRLLAPMFPLAVPLARTRWSTGIAIMAGILLQYVWIDACWRVSDLDWTPP